MKIVAKSTYRVHAFCCCSEYYVELCSVATEEVVVKNIHFSLATIWIARMVFGYNFLLA